MEKTSKELLKEFVKSQKFTSTTDIMNSMKELFSDALQAVMEAEFEENLGYEKANTRLIISKRECRKTTETDTRKRR